MFAVVCGVILFLHHQVLSDMFGDKCRFKNVLQCEFDKRKRTWIKSFSRPEMLTGDVEQLKDDMVFDYITGEERALPANVDFWSFGYSCKDLSSLNNFSHSYKDTCLQTKTGSTGRTWRGNLDYVAKTRPLYVLMENVMAAMRGDNFRQMRADLAEMGYVLLSVPLNAAEAGFPQDRWRAYFVGIRNDLVDPSLCQDAFEECINDMKLDTALPIGKFLLPPNHSYLLQVMHDRRQRAKERAMKKLRTKLVTKKKPAATKQKRSGLQWKVDHWRCRRLLGMPGVQRETPEQITNVATCNAMCEREADLYHIVSDTNPDPQCTPTIELKHSAPRVVRPVVVQSRIRGKRYKGSTSCLLPSSKMLLFQPHVPEPRYLLGAEALALQGIPHCYTTVDTVVQDGDLMNLGGNAFNGGCAAMVVIAAMISSTFPDGERSMLAEEQLRKMFASEP